MKTSFDFINDIIALCDLRNENKNFKFQNNFGNSKGFIFQVPKRFKEHFNIPVDRIAFQTHKELDEFCIKILQSCLDVKIQFPNAWNTLMLLDRYFWSKWLRHNPRNNNQKRFRPAPPKNQPRLFMTSCPFKDPRKTVGYIE